MNDKDRKTLAVLLGLGGVVAAGLAFWQGKAAQSADLVSRLSGGIGRPGDRTIMWILIGAAALLLIAALVTWLSVSRDDGQAPAKPALVPGWYDDPESPDFLRYWDGSRWTDNKAAKDKGSSPPS